MLGRVSSVDNTLAILCEAASALLAGILQDRAGFSARGVSWLIAAVGWLIVLCWSIYHITGGGVKDRNETNGLTENASPSKHAGRKQTEALKTEQSPLIENILT